MKIISWNVNGLRARIKKGFNEAINELEPDILCLQEVRALPSQLPSNFLEEYYHYNSIHDRAGYAGTSIYIKKKLNQPDDFLDDYIGGTEPGRLCILEFNNLFLISSYSPNSGQYLEKLSRRILWENELTEYLSKLNKPIIMCGDLNCAPSIKDAGINCLAGCSPEERMAFRDKLELGLIDVFREKNPYKIEYTWFSYRDKKKEKGLRLDEFLISKEFVNKIQNFRHIYDEKIICGSDHIPIELMIEL